LPFGQHFSTPDGTLGFSAEGCDGLMNVDAIASGYMAARNTQSIKDDPVCNEQILACLPGGGGSQRI
jgi:hypothetical protein